MNKRIFVIMAAVAAVFASSCSKTVDTPLNSDAVKVFDSYLHINGYDNLPVVAEGTRIYILEENKGTGVPVGTPEDHPYVNLEFTVYDLDGNVSTTSDILVAQRIGSYADDGTYYGPYVWGRADNNLYVSVEYMLQRMNVGGSLKCVVPGWYQTYTTYENDAQYMANVEGSDAIYELKVTEVIDDIEKWEVDSLNNFIAARYAKVDTLDTLGAYYARIKEPVQDTLDYSDGDQVYINYIGRLLNGQVFDTNIKDTAVLYGLSVSNDGEPIYFTWKEEPSELTLGEDDSNVITGFALILQHMHEGEKGRGMFVSSLGYSSSGSGETIPPYSPLIFDIECIGTKD